MNRKYDKELDKLHRKQSEAALQLHTDRSLESLRTEIQSEISGLINCEIESEVFYKTMLECLTVFKDRHMELRLKYLPQKFHFAD